MKHILVLCRKMHFDKRRTVRDHLYSFKRYRKDCRFIYFNVLDPSSFSTALLNFKFDAVLLHYTFLALRFGAWKDYSAYYQSILPLLRRLNGVKALLPHDEYFCPQALWDIASDLGVRRIYASCYPNDYGTLFPPDKVGGEGLCTTVQTGYVEESLIPRLRRLTQNNKKTLDIGYRAAEGSFFYGKHGLIKSQVARETQKALARHPKLKTDIKLADSGYNNIIQGDAWLRFLARCRTVLGCLGGSSLIDPNGSSREAIITYTKQHPDAGYQEVSQHCYTVPDGTISAFLLGPRFFECALARTCQLLVEGDYRGILLPGVDYIEIKADYSNLDEVLTLVEDADYCKKIADQCYEHLVESGKYTYRLFANTVLRDLLTFCPAEDAASDSAFFRMAFRHQIHTAWNRTKSFVRSCFYQGTNILSILFPHAYEKLRALLFPHRDRETFRHYPK